MDNALFVAIYLSQWNCKHFLFCFVGGSINSCNKICTPVPASATHSLKVLFSYSHGNSVDPIKGLIKLIKALKIKFFSHKSTQHKAFSKSNKKCNKTSYSIPWSNCSSTRPWCSHSPHIWVFHCRQMPWCEEL
jgi:hypothetical protein